MEIPMTIKNLYLIYSSLIETNIEQLQSRQAKLYFPKVPQVLLSQICNFAANEFQKDDNIMEINEDVIIVGDLHGHILDLFRIFQTYGIPPNSTYIFLGDIVDRGEFSLETITLLFILKILFPSTIYIIRGNHEFGEMCEYCGFFNELSKAYGNKITQTSFIHAFSYMPFAANVQHTYLCVHGGIGPTISSLSQINSIKRPVFDYNFEPLLSILWSDPSSSVTDFRASPRGTGFLFGSSPLKKFLQYNNLKALIRGHECVEEGIQNEHQGMCITVFSASNYCGLQPNKAGVLQICQTFKQPKTRIFKPLKYLKRCSATIVATDCKSPFLLPNPKKQLPNLSQQQKNDDPARSSRPIKPRFALNRTNLRHASIRSSASVPTPKSIVLQH